MSVKLVKEYPRTNDYYGIHPKLPGTIEKNEYEIKLFAGGHQYGWSMLFEDYSTLEVDTCHSVKGSNHIFQLANGALLQEWGIYLISAKTSPNDHIILQFHNSNGNMVEMGRLAPFWLASLIITPKPKQLAYISC